MRESILAAVSSKWIVFLNHQVDPQLTWRMAKVIHDSFLAEGVRRITRVLTAEVSGIPVALQVAEQFGAQMIYARKSHSRTMTGTYYVAEAVSRTRGTSSELMVGPSLSQRPGPGPDYR